MVRVLFESQVIPERNISIPKTAPQDDEVYKNSICRGISTRHPTHLYTYRLSGCSPILVSSCNHSQTAIASGPPRASCTCCPPLNLMIGQTCRQTRERARVPSGMLGTFVRIKPVRCTPTLTLHKRKSWRGVQRDRISLTCAPRAALGG